MDKSTSAKSFNNKSLLALTTLYGVELLEDNVEMLVMNMTGEDHSVKYTI